MYSSLHEKIHKQNNLLKLRKVSGCRGNVVDTPALPRRLRGVGWYLVTGLEMLNI